MKKICFGFLIDSSEPKAAAVIKETLTEVVDGMNDKEKTDLVRKVVSSHVKNAMVTEEELATYSEDIQKRMAKGSKVMNFTDLLENGYGVCLQMHSLAMILFESIGIPCELWGNNNYHHCFLRIRADDTEQVFDHFSEVWQNKLFPDDCYDKNYSKRDETEISDTECKQSVPKLSSNVLNALANISAQYNKRTAGETQPSTPNQDNSIN